MKFSAIFLVALAFTSCVFGSLQNEGYFLGRSGDVVIASQPNNIQASIQTSWAMEGESLIDTQFHALVARQLGLPFSAQISSADRLPVKMDVFSPRRANLFIVVDGVTSDELALRDASLSASKAVRSSYSPSASSASLIASMLTGATPRQHGIVADKWDYLGETEHAYIHAFPEVAQIADLLAQSSHGESHIVSASASPIFARALGVRPSLHAYAQNSATLHYDVHRRAVYQVSGKWASPVASMSQNDLHQLIRTHFRDETLLQTPEHDALYAELAMVLKSVSELSLHAQGASSPDLYNFAITALNPIRALHSESSSEYTSALALVRKTLVRAIEKIQHAYDDQAIYEVLCIRSSRPESIINEAARILDLPSLDFFPNVYTTDLLACSELRKAGIDAYCPASSEERIAAQQSFAGSVISKRDVILEADADLTVGVWHMFMWTWLVLILIVYFVWYAFYTMDIGEDSLLYRLTAIPSSSRSKDQ